MWVVRKSFSVTLITWYGNVRAVRVAYAVYGPTQAVLPIVILHGVLGHKLNWRSTAIKLAKESGRQVCGVYW